MSTPEELEQAEARLDAVRVKLWDLINAELRSALANGKAALSIRTDIVECIERDWPDAALEVGRLRALALNGRSMDRAVAAIQGVYEQDDSLPLMDGYHMDQIARAVISALAVHEEAS